VRYTGPPAARRQEPDRPGRDGQPGSPLNRPFAARPPVPPIPCARCAGGVAGGTNPRAGGRPRSTSCQLVSGCVSSQAGSLWLRGPDSLRDGGGRNESRGKFFPSPTPPVTVTSPEPPGRCRRTGDDGRFHPGALRMSAPIPNTAELGDCFARMAAGDPAAREELFRRVGGRLHDLAHQHAPPLPQRPPLGRDRRRASECPRPAAAHLGGDPPRLGARIPEPVGAGDSAASCLTWPAVCRPGKVHFAAESLDAAGSGDHPARPGNAVGGPGALDPLPPGGGAAATEEREVRQPDRLPRLYPGPGGPSRWASPTAPSAAAGRRQW